MVDKLRRIRKKDPWEGTTARDIVLAARAKIENPEDWFGNGQGMGEGQMCLLLALAHCSPIGDKYTELKMNVYTAVHSALPATDQKSDINVFDILRFNDSHSHQACLDLLDAALEHAPELRGG